ncbi:MAG: hypothetical protein RL514_3508 [Verrucomicrobiota bacterium]|jgi:hypothetical protein
MNRLTLPTGRTIPLEYLTFDAASQHAYYGSLDVTEYMTRAQIQAVGGSAFDVEQANREASDAARIARGLAPYEDPPQITPWEVLTNTARGIGNDVATAAQGVRDFVGIGPENAGKHSPLFWFAIVAGLGWIAYQLGVFVWLRKKLTA